MHAAVRFRPISVDVFLSGSFCQSFDPTRDFFKGSWIRFLKRDQAVGLPAIFPDLLHKALIGAEGFRHRIICRRLCCPGFPVQKNGHRLVDLRIIAIPAQPAVLYRIKAAADGSGGRHRCRRKYCRIRSCQMRSEKSIRLQISV